jgi:multidrug resistance efflux pump
VKRKPVILAVAALAVVVALMVSLSRRQVGTRAVSGTIETDEVHIASRYGGRVARLLAQEGNRLNPGQLVVELDAAELRARRDQATALLQELEHGPRPEEIAAAKADWEALRAQRDFARAEEQRSRELFEQKVVSSTERDQAASRADALDRSVAAAKARHDLLLAGTRAERLDQARAQLAEIDAQLREMAIVSPGNCVLEVLNVKVGDVLPPNREVATLLLADRLWVRVYVPETWLGRIQLGQQVKVQTDSSREEFTGTVEQVNRQAEFTPRNVQTVEDRVRQVFGVKVRLPAETNILKPGMAADVFFPDVPAQSK